MSKEKDFGDKFKEVATSAADNMPIVAAYKAVNEALKPDPSTGVDSKLKMAVDSVVDATVNINYNFSKARTGLYEDAGLPALSKLVTKTCDALDGPVLGPLGMTSNCQGHKDALAERGRKK
jgi:hypothetical protein